MKHSSPFVFSRSLLSASIVACCLCSDNAAAQNQRVLGIDVSAWQGDISQTTWNNIRTNENRRFVFIRSSRGGTTGYYNQSNAGNNNPPGQNTFSQRYDDPYYIQNINRATAAGMLAGSYHFSRPDIIESTLNSGGIANTGTDEADHFIQMAGPYMRPGYLLPVHDLEAGNPQRTSTALSQFCVDFSDRIYEVMRIRPLIYVNQSYANYINSTVPAVHPHFWIARYPYGSGNPYLGDLQVDHPPPSPSTANVYGKWNPNHTVENPYPNGHPWSFWQYGSGDRLQSFNNGNSNLDGNVAQGGIEFVKDFLVPAVWWHDSSGQWTTITNWNSGQTPIQPVPGPGQVAPVATGPLPTPRLPSTNDTIVLDRPNANIIVTLASGTHNIRKLFARESLNITGGSLTINYTPSWDSTTMSAQFSAPVALNNATLAVHTLQVDPLQTFTVGGGTLNFSQIVLMQGVTSATLALTGNVNLNSWSNGLFSIVNGSGFGNSGTVDLADGIRALSINSGADLSVNVPVQNGALTKNGAGTLRLNAANSFAGGTVVNAGKLFVNNTTGSGTGSGSVTISGGTLGGTGTISGVATINSGGTVAPGTDAALGTLTFGSTPVLNGTNFFRIDRNGGSPQSDRIARSGGALNFGGRLVVSNIGAALTGGELFTLFSANSYSGNFTATNLPSLSTNLNWFLGNLAVNGTIRVNRKPTAVWIGFNSTPGQTLTIPKATLIGSGSDADGNPLSLASFDSVTTNGISLTSDSTNIYYFNNANVADRFSYTLDDGQGGLVTSQVLIGQGVPTPPSITSGPSSLTVMAGQNANLSVTASGTAPLSYQWRFNGANIANATNSTYTRVNAQPADAGNYTVFVSNAQGNATSAAATLTVVTPVTITTHPQSTNVAIGNAANFTVGATGTAPLSYQWFFQSSPLSGATNSSLTLNSVTTNQLGNYHAVVSNPYSSATSQVATLALPLLEVLWQLPPYSRSYLTTNDLPEQRGMTYNPVTRRLLLVHRMTPTVHVLNADTGADLWTLNTNGVTGGLNNSYFLLLIAAAEDGAIYACNLKASSNPFKIYRWANDSSNTVPTVAFSGDPSPGTPGYRWGDTFDVRGSGTNTQILIGPRQGTNVILLTTTDGLNFTPNVINLTDAPSGHCGLNVTFGRGDTIWGTTHTNLLRLLSFNLGAGTASTLRLYNDNEVPTAVNPIGFSSSLNILAGIHVNSPNHLRVYDLSSPSYTPMLIGTNRFLTDNNNTHTGTGAVRFGDDVIYALNANNGLMAVRILMPNEPLRFHEMSIGPQLILRGKGKTGNYVVEATSSPFTNWTPVTNLAIGVNGNFDFSEIMTNAPYRFFRLRKE